jgi:hypothetical protein
MAELFGPGHFVGLGLGLRLRLKSEIRTRARTRARTSTQKLQKLQKQVIGGRAFRTRPFRRTRTQTEVRNSDSDSGLDLRNCDFPTP